MHKTPKRILGHARIFQSVFNDLNMRHEKVMLSDGTESWAYVYSGSDPYQLEDSNFPGTVESIMTYATKGSCADGYIMGLNAGKKKMLNDMNEAGEIHGSVYDYRSEELAEKSIHSSK